MGKQGVKMHALVVGVGVAVVGVVGRHLVSRFPPGFFYSGSFEREIFDMSIRYFCAVYECRFSAGWRVRCAFV